MKISDCLRSIVHSEFMNYNPHALPNTTVFLNFKEEHPFRKCEYKLHSTGVYELIIPIGAEYECMLDGEHIKVACGEFLLIQPYQLHRDIFSPGSPFYAFHFLLRSGGEDSQPVQRIFALKTTPPEQKGNIPDSDFFNAMLAQMRVKSNSFAVQNALFQAFFLKMLDGIGREHFFEGATATVRESERIRLLLGIFKRHYTDNPSLAGLCVWSGMSRSSLNRFCNEYLGDGPLKAFMKFKISFIQDYMTRNPLASVKTISRQFGFSSPFHFSKTFRKYLGYPPSKHRGIVQNE